MAEKKWMVLILLCIFLTGCGPEDAKEKTGSEVAADQEHTIKKLTVSYVAEEAGGGTDQIRIDFEDGTKEIRQFRGDQVREQTESCENMEELRLFVSDTLLPLLEEKAKERGSSEQMILWDISVRTDGQSYHMKGFDGYPSYWDELLEYLKGDQVRRNDG